LINSKICVLKYSVDDIIKKLDNLVVDEKAYLKHRLTIKEISVIIGVNYKYISIAIKEYYSTDFRNYLNKHRVSYAKRLLVSKEFQTSSIDHISDLCGFKSRTTFYKYFKKEENLTPSEYQEKFFLR
jgi:YesN/AraC family two-component response regulator